MNDQTDKLEALGLDPSPLNSALTAGEERQSLTRLKRGTEFVLTTPERLASDAAIVSTGIFHPNLHLSNITVAEYGDGEIRGFDGDKVEVAFADGSVHKFKRDYLR